YSEPRQATHTRKSVGSVTIPASVRSPRDTSALPPAPDDSSSVFVATTRSPARRTPSAESVSAANVIAAIPPFISHAPRPYRRPSRTTPLNGSLVHSLF